ncbi:MAG: discoidin domain-containing protein [Candidatus Omnitrophica bacterium]|nr:discoidin domain-containing protein [Candidatus Omnitrophota bacterium]
MILLKVKLSKFSRLILMSSVILFYAVTICVVAIAKEEQITVENATASSTYYNNQSYGPFKSIDGEYNTYWLGERYATPWWIMFDMGELKYVDKINLVWYSSYYVPSDYDIQISNDSTNWENIYSGIQGIFNMTGNEREINRDARYIRLYIRGANYFPVLREITAYKTTSIPHLIRFQGTLKDRDGIPLEGTLALIFRLYNVETGGSPLWEESQQGINMENGLLDVELGSVTPLNLSFDEQYWLGVEVESDGEMTPRFKLTAVPYAFTSDE